MSNSNNTTSVIQFIQDAYRIKSSSLVRQDIELLPVQSEVRALAELLKPKVGQCYLNAALLVLELKIHGYDAHYVCGVSDLSVGFPSGHAWIELDGHHYDSTLELGKGTIASHYFEIFRMSYGQLWDWLNRDGESMPPYFPDDVPSEHFDKTRFQKNTVSLKLLSSEINGGFNPDCVA